MKKIILSILLVTTIFAGAFAQGYDVVEAGDEVNFNHNEVYLTAGMPSFVGFFSGMFVAIFQGIAESINNSENGEGSGEGSGGSSGSGSSGSNKEAAAFTISGGYNYFFTENFGLGAFASYEKFDTINLMTVQAKVTAQYGWEHFKFYHAVSGGILFAPGIGNSGVSGVFDVTLLGLKADFDNWNVFVEASIPSTGMLKAGASFKF